jgi:carboxyl-terminal processing protease
MTISHKNIFFWLIVSIFAFVLGYFASGYHPSYDNYAKTGTWPIYDSPKAREVYSFLEKYYYGFQWKDRTKLEDDYLDAMTMSLWDRHTNYFNPVNSTKFVDSLSGDFQWIGAVIQTHKKGIQVMKVLSKSPAEKAGIKEGDVISHVDGLTMVGVPTDEAVDKIRGEKGTEVRLSIIRADDTKEDIIVIRDTVIVPSVDSKMLTGSVGYIEIALFGETTADDVELAIASLSASGATAFIIDGRNNGGWYLDSAVDILSLFLKEKTPVIITKWTNIGDNKVYLTYKIPEKIADNIPIVMLINSMSASATEILAWALQDHNRAIIVGETSYGKWSVQTPFSLSDGSMIKITTAKWYTPNERSIDEKGITPDVEEHLKESDYTENYDRQLELAREIITLKKETELTFDEWKESAKDVTIE